MKKLLSLALSLLLTVSISIPASAKESTSGTFEYNEEFIELESAYRSLSEYAEAQNALVETSLEEYIWNYNSQIDGTVEAYLNNSINALEINTAKMEIQDNYTPNSSGDDLWQYNKSELSQPTSYDTYTLLTSIATGDIVHEANGGFGITGHTGFIEGHYYSSLFQQYYVRIIEAIDVGVVRSILDDERVDIKDASLYRVTATTDERMDAEPFPKK